MLLCVNRRVKHIVQHTALDRRHSREHHNAAQHSGNHRPNRLHRHQPNPDRRYQRDQHRHLDLASQKRCRAAETGIADLPLCRLRIPRAQRKVKSHQDKRQGECIRVQHARRQNQRHADRHQEHRHDFSACTLQLSGDSQCRTHAQHIQCSLQNHQRKEKVRHAQCAEQPEQRRQHQQKSPLIGEPAQIQPEIRIGVKIAISGKHL